MIDIYQEENEALKQNKQQQKTHKKTHLELFKKKKNVDTTNKWNFSLILDAIRQFRAFAVRTHNVRMDVDADSDQN